MKSWLPSRRRSRRAGRSSCTTRNVLQRRPLFETLELRRVLATYTWDISGSSLSLSLSGDEQLTVAQAGSNYLFTSTSNINQFGGDTATGSGTNTLTIAGSDLRTMLSITGNGDVRFSGNGSFSSDQITVNLSSVANTIEFTGGFDLVSTSVLGIHLETPREIIINADSTLTTTHGDITLRANQDLEDQIEFEGPHDFKVGIRMNGGAIITNGRGDILLQGRGGRNIEDDNYGVLLENGAIIQSTSAAANAGTITVEGRGGGDYLTIPAVDPEPDFADFTLRNYGVLIRSVDTLVTSVSGNIQITGQGSLSEGADDYGVYLNTNSKVSSTGIDASAATITINGTGGGFEDRPNTRHYGVRMNNSATVQSLAGAILINGQGGTGDDFGNDHYGVLLENSALVTAKDGKIEVVGTGGELGVGHIGVLIRTGGKVQSTGTGPAAATINIIGSGGADIGGNAGVVMRDSGSLVTSVDGNIEIRGGGGQGGSNNVGVLMTDQAKVTSTGTTAEAATIFIEGIGSQGIGSHGVVIQQNGTEVVSNQGNIEIVGTAGSFGSNNVGVRIVNAGKVRSTGEGATAAGIVINGTGGLNSASFNYGVLVEDEDSYVSAVDGSIHIIGVGGGNNTGQLNVGVSIDDKGQVFSTGTGPGIGMVTIEGTGGSGLSNNHGIRVVNDALVTSKTRTIILTGFGGGSENANIGIVVSDGGAVTSTGEGENAANVILDGRGASTTAENTNHYGVRISGSESFVTSIDGDIFIQGFGGDGVGGDNNHGVLIDIGGTVTSTGTNPGAATIFITGQGGVGHTSNYGVHILHTGSLVTSMVGAIQVVGRGGQGIDDDNVGVRLADGGRITSPRLNVDAAKISVSGTGGQGVDDNHGVQITDSESYITSVYGDINVTSTGGSGTGNRNTGLHLTNGGRIFSSGTDADAATITINVTGGTGLHSNHGLFIDSPTARITSVTGDINITAKGGDATGNTNTGISLQNGGRITSTGTGVDAANITIFATGGKGVDSNYGLYLQSNGSTVTTFDGDLTITGIGGEATGSFNYGVYVASSVISSTGNTIEGGSVTINGTGGGAIGNNAGVVVNGITGRITSVIGDIKVTGTGGNGSGSGNVGVLVTGSGAITSSGADSDAANIEIKGTGGLGTNDNHGVHITGNNSFVTSLDGEIGIIGIGGDGSGVHNHGVSINDGAFVSSTGNTTAAALITIDGTGGNAAESYGVNLDGTNLLVQIVSEVGNIQITGQGGSHAGGNNVGVFIQNEVQIRSTGILAAANITIDGTGGNDGDAGNTGVRIGGVDSVVSSINGNIYIVGDAGANESVALILEGNAAINSTGEGSIDLIADSMNIGLTSTVNAGMSIVTVRPKSDGTGIDIGAPQGLAINLVLTDAELDRITAGLLIVGSDTTGAISIDDVVTRSAATDIQLRSGQSINFVGGSINTAGGDVVLAPGVGGVVPGTDGVEIIASEVSFQSDLTIVILGAMDNEYTQLNVEGIVDLSGVTLVLGGDFQPLDQQVFTIVTATGGVMNEFDGLGEGSEILFNGVRMIVNYTPNTVTLTADRNTAPVAGNQNVGTRKDVPLVTTVPATDAENHPLTYSIVTGPTHGTVMLDANTGEYTYTPDAGYTGPDSFTFRVNDGRLDSNVGTISITVSPFAPPTLAVQNSTGAPGALIPLNIQAAPGEVDDHFRVIISGVPAGSTFWRNGVQTGTDIGGNQWRFTQAQLNGLSIKLPADQASDVVLVVTARSKHVNNDVTDVSKNLTVFVVLFEPPTLTVQDANGSPGVKIPLDIQASPGQPEDHFRVTISGVPAGATFWRGNTQTGTNLGGGQWRFTQAWLNGLSIQLPNNHVGDVVLTVVAKAVHTDGNSQEVMDTLTITVVPANPSGEEGNMIVVGAEAGSLPWVQVIDKATNSVISKFLAYDASFRGGVRVAVGDMTGDGVAEIITAQGAGDRNVVRVFTINGTELRAFRTVAYSGSGGVNLAVGDVDGDGRNDIVTAPSSGVAEIRVFRNVFITGNDPLNPTNDPIGSPYRRFTAYPTNFTGGAVVAVADMGKYNGRDLQSNAPDGKAEIIVGNGPGASSRVLIYNAQPSTPVIVKIINPFSSNFTGGIASIDVARVNNDSTPDIVIGAGQGFGSMVRVFDGRTGSLLTTIRAYEGASRNSAVKAAFLDTNDDGIADTIVTAQGIGGTTREIRSFNPLTGALVDQLFEGDLDFDGEYHLATGV